jgi:hypothetical protein
VIDLTLGKLKACVGKIGQNSPRDRDLWDLVDEFARVDQDGGMDWLSQPGNCLITG